MVHSSQPAKICEKCFTPLLEFRDPRMKYCSSTCAETGGRRQRRRKPIADPVSVERAFTLAQRNAQLQRDVQAFQRNMLRARASRNEYEAKVRSLEGEVIAARRLADKIVVQQASRTVAARRETSQLQRVNNALRELTSLAPEPITTSAPADATTITGLLARLTAGNAAYKELVDQHHQLKAAFQSILPQVKRDTVVYRQWNMLCSRLYKNTRGTPTAEADQKILTTWLGWREALSAQVAQNSRNTSK